MHTSMIVVGPLRQYPEKPFGYEWWAHMFSPDLDLEALHTIAQGIGLKRVWFQAEREAKANFCPHYDVTPSKHKLAIRHGVQLLTFDEEADILHYMYRTHVDSHRVP